MISINVNRYKKRTKYMKYLFCVQILYQSKIKLFVWNCLLPHWNSLTDKILIAKNKEFFFIWEFFFYYQFLILVKNRPPSPLLGLETRQQFQTNIFSGWPYFTKSCRISLYTRITICNTWYAPALLLDKLTKYSDKKELYSTIFCKIQ